MDTTIYIKSDDFEKIKSTIVSDFGFFENGNKIILGNHLSLEINDITLDNKFTFKFLEDNKLEDCNDFYRLVNLKNFNIEISIYYVNKNIDAKDYIELIISIFKHLSLLLVTEIVINFNDVEYYLLNNDVELLYFRDNRNK